MIYECIKCGHIVVSDRKPEPIHWTDGHVCIFEIGEMEKEFQEKKKKENQNG